MAKNAVSMRGYKRHGKFHHPFVPSEDKAKTQCKITYKKCRSVSVPPGAQQCNCEDTECSLTGDGAADGKPPTWPSQRQGQSV